MYLRDGGPWFSFLVHPRDLRDLETMPGASLLRRYSADEDDFVAKATTAPALVSGDVTFQGAAIRGEIVGIARLPHQILSLEGREAVVEGVRLAAARGSAVVGLGALTAPVTRGGETVLPIVGSEVTLTNGNGYTAALAVRNVQDACVALRLGAPLVAVVGCTGSVGVAASGLLAEDGLEPVLIGRVQAKVDELVGDLAGRAQLTTDMTRVADADVVLVLTSHATAHLTPEMLRPGCVVIDVAQPANLTAAEIPAFEARDIQVRPGAITRIPGYSCTQEFALSDPADTFACLAETYLLAREGIREHSVGRPSADYARDMEALALHHGITPRPLGLRSGADETRDAAMAGS